MSTPEGWDKLIAGQTLKLGPDSMLAFLFLGSDGSLRIKKGGKGKAGEITAQHGDVIGIQSEAEAIELHPRFDGFGFRESLLCLAQFRLKEHSLHR
jgi:hypothetical protein